jgi:hypothetical protein
MGTNSSVTPDLTASRGQPREFRESQKYLRYFLLACLLTASFFAGATYTLLKTASVGNPLVFIPEGENCFSLKTNGPIRMQSYDSYGKKLSTQKLYEGSHWFCLPPVPTPAAVH